MRNLSQNYLDELTYKIIGAAIEVHKELGPGLLERDYEKAFMVELELQGISATTQKPIEMFYKGHKLSGEIRYDVLVEKVIVVEIKSVTKLIPIFEAVTMSYMTHLKIPKGILINFNVSNIFHEWQKTFVNQYFSQLPRY